MGIRGFYGQLGFLRICAQYSFFDRLSTGSRPGGFDANGQWTGDRYPIF